MMFLFFLVIVFSVVAAATDTTCRCYGNCQQFPQSACTSCQSDWFGKFCQKRNIARGKETNQSSTYYSKNFGGPYPSQFAVDGDTDNNMDHYSCTHTDDTRTEGAWWRVFLGPDKHNISQMTIFLRPGYLDRNDGFKVYVDDHLCFSVATTSVSPLNVKCESPLNGNVVTVRINGTMLTLCEVQVFVCSDGWFRSDCDKQCQCSDRSEVCDKDTGYCRSGCAAGKHGDGCQQECTNGYYGENCALRCGRCKDDRSCNKISGFCVDGCQAGFQMPLCKKCTGGYYGDTCTKKCGHCKDHICNKANGICDAGCQEGFQIPYCKTCTKERFGHNCSSMCGHCKDGQKCDVTTGHCPEGCGPGYIGLECLQECTNGNYGDNCSSECSYCKDHFCNKASGVCDNDCQKGFQMSYCKTCISERFGDNCSSLCGHCKDGQRCDTTTGHCPEGCKPGYMEPECLQACTKERFGHNCSSMCGHCKDGQRCDVTTGHCPEGCGPGYIGLECLQECTNENYGDNCSSECSYCKDHFCNKASGVCDNDCQKGFQMSYCKTCISERFGDNCSSLCGHCKDGQRCDTTTGHCPEGCKPGYMEPECLQEHEQSSSQPTKPVLPLAVGIPVAIIVVVVVVVVAVVILRRRHQRKSRDAQQVHNDILETHVNNLSDNKHAKKQQLYGDETMGEHTNSSTKASNPNRVNPDSASKELVTCTNVYENSNDYYNTLPSPIPVATLGEYIKEKLCGVGFAEEYKLLRYGLQASHEEAKKPENKKRNRFLEIFPYDHSRVILSPDGDAKSGYINASYITGFHASSIFIAAQGPNGVTLDDFWRMIWQENVAQIIMLTRVMEMTKKKCEQYWPNDSEEKKCGPLVIKANSVKTRADFTIREFTVHHKRHPSDTRTITHLHFTTWQDHHVPSPPALVGFWKQYRNLQQAEQETGPVVVHCSAGVGRTGAFIALDSLFEEAENRNKVDVFTCVSKMREARMNMVQTVSQYQFVHEALLEAIRSKGTFYTLQDSIMTFGTDTSFSQKQEMDINKQFQSLDSLRTELNEECVSEARLPENVHKNKNQAIVPGNKTRPYLSTPVTSRNEYINAVIIPSATRPLAMIVTQTPLKETIVDFWRLVYDHDCFDIVCLDNTEVNYPQTDESLESGPFRITFCQQDTTVDSFTKTQLTLTVIGKIDSTRQVTVYKPKCTITENMTAFLELVNAVDARSYNPEHKVLVHCPDGARLSGLFCSVLTIISRLRLDKEVDIFLTIRELQCIRPQFIDTYDQYKFCYDMVKEYYRSSNVYANM